MKKVRKYIWLLTVALLTASCSSFDDLKGVEEIAPISVNVALDFKIDGVTEFKELKIKFDNYEEDLHYTKDVVGDKVEMNDIVPGLYSVNVSGTGVDAEDNEYFVNGSIQNKGIFNDGTLLDITVKGVKVSPLVFKELYYSNTRDLLGKSYIFEQFYEIYNNSSSVLHLDGVYFADLYPQVAKANSTATWPAEDGDKYVYGRTVWKFPGNGTDYPLEPGESCVVSEYAFNHQLEGWNPNSPLDQTSADMEFYIYHKTFPNNNPAPDMEIIFYNGNKTGSLKQYLTTPFGSGLVIFQVPEDVIWDPINDPTMYTKNLATTAATLYAKIPIEYILDAVECVENEANIIYKRIPGVLDAGATWVGGSYNGLGVCRKLSYDDDGNPLQRENGAYIYQDTNNSTDDFERGLLPMLRRNDAKMPSWNHTLN
ncbi:MAG: DUF4876 domain-containing protein [Bacteroides sp.]|nr:DUF4876 domain-containing protein [Bacteroides sp.]